MRLSGREQVSHKTLSALIAELELYGYVEVERKGRGRGRGVDFYIYPSSRSVHTLLSQLRRPSFPNS
jgi:CDC6, C terminal.